MQTKKEASAKQESMVANYMGWKVVSGSGARPFRPGDIHSNDFLVECKTHVDIQDSIIFYKKHWNKISEEATSINKYPALVTDNGTQKSQSTWVMVPISRIPDNAVSVKGVVNTSKSGNTIIFNKNQTDSLFKNIYEPIRYFSCKFDNDNLAIMPLSDFKNLYEQEFEL